MPSGLERTASTPMVEVSDWTMDSSYIVKSTMGTFGIKLRRTEAASAPFIRGMARSREDQVRFQRYRLLDGVEAVHSFPANLEACSGFEKSANHLTDRGAVVCDKNLLGTGTSSLVVRTVHGWMML